MGTPEAAPMDARRHMLEEQLEREVLQSERLRATLLAAAFTLASPFLLALLSLLPQTLGLPHAEFYARVRLIVGVGLAFVIGYTWAMRALFGWMLRHERRPPRWLRFLNALVEVSTVTALLIAFSHTSGPLFAFSSPPTHIYIVFILLSVLQLDRALSLFMGVAACAQYLAAAAVYLAPLDTSGLPALFASPVPLLVKGLVMLLCGGLAAFIGAELRRRLLHTLTVVEERRRTVEMFGQHVSPQVASQLLQHSGDFRGELRHVCVLFLDIRDFTRFSESRSPQEVVAFLDTLFEPLVEVVGRHGGIINKFLGDGFMAVFGAPFSDGQECRAAVRAALELVRQVEALERSGRIPPTRVGIGLHAGPAVTGTIGARSRREYTVIGDTVNLASRIEQLTKAHGATVLASEPVWEQAQGEGLQAQALEPLQVKGRQTPVRVFRLG
jgi:adenylate cyclase